MTTSFQWHRVRNWLILRTGGADGRMLCVVQAMDRRVWEIRILRVVDGGRFELGAVLEEAASQATAKRIAERRMSSAPTAPA